MVDGKTVTTDKGIWETATRRFLLGLKGKRTAFLKQKYSIEPIAYSPDGKTLAMATRWGNAEARNGQMIRLWDAATAAELPHFGTQAVRALAYSPDGKLVAAGNDDGTVGLWDVGTGREHRRIAAHARDVNSVAFSPDGKVVASCTFDGDIRLWDASTGKVAGQISVTEHVRAITFAPNGKALVAAGQPDLSQDGACISVWELSTALPRLRLAGHQGSVVSLAFAGGSRFFASGSDDTRLWFGT
jgi:WD40 repeat protein